MAASAKTIRKLLNIYGGMSHGEIAEIKQMPPGTVKTHIRRGIGKVREIISQPAPQKTVAAV